MPVDNEMVRLRNISAPFYNNLKRRGLVPFFSQDSGWSIRDERSVLHRYRDPLQNQGNGHPIGEGPMEPMTYGVEQYWGYTWGWRIHESPNNNHEQPEASHVLQKRTTGRGEPVPDFQPPQQRPPVPLFASQHSVEQRPSNPGQQDIGRPSALPVSPRAARPNWNDYVFRSERREGYEDIEFPGPQGRKGYREPGDPGSSRGRR